MPAEEDHTSLSEMADRLGLEGEERDDYITEHMHRFGYKPRTVWDDAPEENEENGNVKGFFKPAKKTAPQKRTVGGKEPKQPYGYGS